MFRPYIISLGIPDFASEDGVMKKISLLFAAVLISAGCGSGSAWLPGASSGASLSPSSLAGGMAAAWELPQSYSMVVSAAYVNKELEGIGKINVGTAGATYYFEALENDADVPVGVQDFLARKCRVFAEGAVIVPEKTLGDREIGWIAGAAYIPVALDGRVSAEVNLSGGEDLFGWNVWADYSISDILRVKLGYGLLEDDDPIFGGDTSNLKLIVETAPKVGGRRLHVAASVDFVDEKGADHVDIGVAGTYYVTNDVGISFGYVAMTGDVEGSTVGLGASYYTGPLGIHAAWQKNTQDSPPLMPDETIIMLKVEYRF